MRRWKTAFSLPLLACLAAAPVGALSFEPVEVRTLVQMPVAVTEVTTFDVPGSQVEAVVTRLNRAEVPVVESVEIIRYTPFDVVLDNYVPADTVAADLPWDLGELDMVLLLDTHLDAGLTGSPLADAVLSDLVRLGLFDAEPVLLPAAPLPVERDFVFFLEPGFRFDSRQGVFADRDVVVVDRDLRVRDRVADFETVRVRGDRFDGERFFDDDRRDVPPGHARHDADGPHPTPGHVKHDGPDGPPGHVRHDDDRRRRANVEREGRNRGPRARVQDLDRDGRRKPAQANEGQGRGKGKGQKAGPRGEGKGKGKGKGGGKGNGKDKGGPGRGGVR